MPSILLPIKPEYVKKIFSHKKRFEFRRTNLKRNFDRVIIYETAPTMKVVGEFAVKQIHRASPKEIWRLTKGFRGCTKSHFDEYFKNRKLAIAIEIESVIVYDDPKELSDVGISFTPQSVVYLD